MKDLILIQGLKRQEKAVFDYIFIHYYSSLCAFATQYINNHNSVEDLVQDFFIYLWAEGSRLEIKSSIKSYLFTSIKNRCLDYQKHQKTTEKYRRYILFSSEQEIDSVENFLVESELRQLVRGSMGKLPPRCREIFELSRHDGLSNQEIADKLGLSKRTVELQISNSLKILKRELAEFIPFLFIQWLIR